MTEHKKANLRFWAHCGQANFQLAVSGQGLAPKTYCEIKNFLHEARRNPEGCLDSKEFKALVRRVKRVKIANALKYHGYNMSGPEPKELRGE